MRTRNLSIGLAVILTGCVRPPSPRPVLLENDRSIVFPQFYEQPAVHVGTGGIPYEFDGTILQAVMIAANHFRPPSAEEQPCRARQEAYRYRIIRQGDIIFVDISEDLEFCGLDSISLDSGATYAISADGRILRRTTGAHPDRILSPASPDAGGQGIPNEPGPLPTLGAPQDLPSRPLPLEPYDGGTGPASPVPPPTPPSVPDGGPPGVP
jgi:hypothetical protein